MKKNLLAFGIIAIVAAICILSFMVELGNTTEYHDRPATMPNFKRGCLEATKIRKPPVSYVYDYRAANRCTSQRQQAWRQQQLDNAYINSANASAEASREWAKYIRTR